MLLQVNIYRERKPSEEKKRESERNINWVGMMQVKGQGEGEQVDIKKR